LIVATNVSAIQLPVCPQCGHVGTYIGVVDGKVQVIACGCGYNAPGVAVAGYVEQAKPEGDAAYWHARAERAEKQAEKLYQAAYCYWAEITSAAYRPAERTRLLTALDKALSDYDQGK
jgi:hypothetical protein